MTRRFEASAFSPGHITGFFEICDDAPDPLQRGSRGAGVNVSSGVLAHVTLIEEHRGDVTIRINGTVSPAPVTRCAVDNVLGRSSVVDASRLSVTVDLRVHLPCSQGFGMSAAGSLSTSLALSHLLGLSARKGVEAAHCAEIEMKTGLGDVVASSVGGIEIRVEPGVGGKIRKIRGSGPVILCVLGDEIKTRDVLTNPLFHKRINAQGKRCMETLLGDPSLETFFCLSRVFAEKTGLASPLLRKVMKKMGRYGFSSMCMLGNSLFAMGDSEGLSRELSRFGNIYHCTVDTRGARLITPGDTHSLQEERV